MRGTVVTDTFTRTVASGWGSADTGQAWTTGIGVGGTVAASDWNVGSGVGTHSVPATLAYRLSYLATFSQSFVDVAVTGSIPVVPTGAPIEVANLMARGTSTTSYYLFRVQVETTGAVTALIFPPGGSQLASVTVPGITYTANLQLRVRAQSVGKVHRMKVWPAAGAEPAAWVLTVVDGTYTGAGFVGVRSGVASGNTNTLPIVFSYDNFNSVLLPDFPKDPLPLTVLAAFGADLSADPSTWPWTNITADVRAGSVNVGPMGRADETSQAAAATCNFQLLNSSLAYSAFNPMSPNYPNVKKNTPIWVIVDPATRFFGYANGFTPSWDTTGKVAVVSVSASGILRRLTQGKTPLRSALYRATSTAKPLAYWPLEDGADSTQAASGITGGAPLTATYGLIKWAGSGGPAGSAPVADFSAGGKIIGPVPPASTASAWRVSFVAKFPAGTPANSGVVLDLKQGGTWPTYELVVDAPGSGGVFLQEFVDNTTFTSSASYMGANLFDGLWHHYRWEASQSGSNVVTTLWLDGVQIISQTLTGATLGAITQVIVNPTGDAAEGVPALGHLAVWAPFAGVPDTLAASRGWAGELATDRMTRLCGEQGVPLTIIGTSTTAMGVQGVDTFVNLLRECEQADLGLLYDGFGPGLGFITRAARYNQLAALTADMAADQVDDPFAPADDDQRNRNLYKVDRKNGSSVTDEDKTSPLGTDPLKGIGVYDSSVTVNVATDGVLLDIASWLVHMGTTPGFRYPALNLDLAAAPALIDNWVAAPLNSRVDILNVSGRATGHPPGTVSVIDEGYTETLTPFGWKVAANCSPAAPWSVATADGTQLRVAAEGSTLAAGITAAALSLQVASTASNGIWTTDLTAYPLDTNLGGEQVTIGSPGQVLNANPWFLVDASGWVGSNATIVRSTAQQYNPAYGSLQVTPDGIGVSGGANGTTRVAATAGVQYLASIWVYATATILLEPAVDWYTATSGGSFISTGLVGAVSVPAGAWTLLSGTLTAPATTLGGLMRARHSGTPAAAAVWYVTAITLVPVTSYTSNPQTMTAAVRAVNGVSKAHNAGEPVDVWSPAVAAL